MNGLLKNIFSTKILEQKKNDSIIVKKQIKFLGFKINIKMYEKFDFETFFDNAFSYLWKLQKDETFYSLVELLQLTKQGGLYSKVQSLIMISTLLDDQHYVTAKFMLNCYIDKYGLDDIHKYLAICNYMVNNNYKTNIKIDNAAKLYEIFIKSENNHTLEKLLENKTVAVVGNGCSALNKGLGQEIDSHDIVIRFNNFSQDEKYLPDLGTKTDIWMVVNGFKFKEQEIEKLKYIKNIWVASETTRQHWEDGFVQTLLDLSQEYSLTLFPIDSLSKKQAVKYSNIFAISSGFYVLHYLKSLTKIKKLDIYGFGFQDETSFAPNITNRYYEDRDLKYTGHNFYKEGKLLADMFKTK